MPYTVDNPPTWLKNLPRGAIAIGVRTFNRVLAETGDEDQARMAAWRNIKLKYKKVGDKWVRKAETDQGIELIFKAAVHSIETGDEKNLGTFYLLNTSKNRMKWGVTDKALEEALPTLLGLPIGCGPDHQLGHFENPMEVGKWVSTDKPDGYALGKADITDAFAWDKLNEGEWGPISVVITAYGQNCSVCGEDLAGVDDPWSHDCIANGRGYVLIDSFRFKRVDFVEVPAWPQAGVINMGDAECEGGVCQTIEFLAEFYESQSTKEGQTVPDDCVAVDFLGEVFHLKAFALTTKPWDGSRARFELSQLRRACAYVEPGCTTKDCMHLPHHEPDGALNWNGVKAAGGSLGGARDGYQGPGAAQARRHLTPHYHAFDKKAPWEKQAGQGPGSLKPDEKGRNKTMSEDKVKELEATIKKLEEQVNTLEAEKAELTKDDGDDDEKKELKAENKILEDRVKALEAARHTEILEKTLDARFKAGLSKDKDADREKLKEMGEEVLSVMEETATSLIAQLPALMAAPVPKAQFKAEELTEFQKAIEGRRRILYGYARDAEGKQVM